MKPFRYDRNTSPDDERTDATFLAGGTDLLPLMKLGRVQPTTVVDLKRGTVEHGVTRHDDSWEILAGTTLSEIQDHAELAAELPAVHQALAATATRQIRNRATIGGNLLQRARCWYYRDPATTCWLAGGDDCPARTGRHEHHAIFDTDGPCIATQPSDLASVLVALDATVVIDDGGDSTTRSVGELLQAPTPDRRALHTLGEAEVISAVRIPRVAGRRSVYLKAMDRASWQFALVGIAVAVLPDDARLVASGVATVPRRLHAAEAALRGRTLDDEAIDAACELVAADAMALEGNRYKLELLEGLTRRALDALVS